ncbi:MAG: hypothetical protein V1492_02525 [Candidatus Micrarchaeota archaeon]
MISEENKEWIKKKLKDYYKTEDIQWEYELMEYGINLHKPTNVREYVEKELKKKEYDGQLGSFMNKTAALNIGDDKKCDELERELEDLLKKANSIFPDFSEKRGRVISELHGDLMAVRTKGKRGSARMLMKLMGQRMELEEKKFKGKKKTQKVAKAATKNLKKKARR